MTIAAPTAPDRPRPTPSVDPDGVSWSTMSRRTVLTRAAIVSTAVAVGPGMLAACGDSAGVTEAMRTAQQLRPLSLAASIDAAAATRLAARTPERSAALTVIAAERQVHATLINDEIARLAPDLARPSGTAGVVADPSTEPTGSTPTGSSPSPATSPATSTESVAAQATAVTSVDDLRRRLEGARTTAADLAVSASGYRAGMLGSVAAALNAEVEVQLA